MSLKQKFKWKAVKDYWVFYVIKKDFFLCVCIKMITFSVKTWSKISVEVIKHNGKNG